VLSPLEVLRSATLVNARILNREGELGVVAPGALADLLVVDGDPLADVSLLAEPEKSLALVMKGGAIAASRLD
jgi:imidazolonepropionase-like amidohydrolase